MASQIRPHARPTAPAVAPPEEVAETRPLRPVARPEGIGAVPTGVADAATAEGALPLDRTTLLGLFAGPEGRHALVRLGSGAVVRAAQGDVVAGGVVTAIADDSLRLWRDGVEEVLTIPA